MSSSTTMPPPPSPLAHRRTKPSPAPNNLNIPSCVSRKMSLSKSATFHQSSSPSTEDDPILSVAHLSKRSTTYTRSSFASWLYSGRDAAADVIADFEQTFSGARGPRPAARRRSAREFEDQLLAKAHQRAPSPVDSGIGSSIGSPSEKNLSRTLDKTLDLTTDKDSALGSSVVGSVTEASELLVKDTSRTRTVRSSGSNPAPLTIIRYTPTVRNNSSQPLLGSFARRQIYKRLFAPLLQEERFQEFRPIVAGTRKNKNLRCLRDIEQSLINQPVTLAVTPSEYRSFGEVTIQLVVDTYQHLSESEQRRPADRPYENGYFLDLIQQVQQLAAHIGSSDTAVEDGSQPAFEDEVTLEGGLAETGNLAELVRWKNGEGISLRTGLPYIPMGAQKRKSSSGSWPMDVEASARRKKNEIYVPPILPCEYPGCDKIFNRPCDKTKHMQTHDRPYKCPHAGCKFEKQGLPTEKEYQRHLNDKHNPDAVLHHCEFCNFSTKRDSNLKQHMEKKHDIPYLRTKGQHKAANLTPGPTPKTPAVDYQSVGPSPSPVMPNMPYPAYASSSGTQSMEPSPYQQPLNNFGADQGYAYGLFPRHGRSNSAYGNSGLNTSVPVNDQFDFNSAIGNYNSNQFGQQFYPTPASNILHSFGTPQTPAYSAITMSPAVMVDNNANANQIGQARMFTPESLPGHSRHASFAPEMPENNMDMGINDVVPMNNLPDLNMDDFITTDIVGDDFQLFGAGAALREGAINTTLYPGFPDMLAENCFTQDQYAPEDFNNCPEVPLFNDDSMGQYHEDDMF